MYRASTARGTDLRQEGIEEKRQVLLGRIGEGHLNHVAKLLAIAVDEPCSKGAGRALGGCDILLEPRLFKILAPLPF